MECTRPGCSFVRHPNPANNGGTHCCAACKRSGSHGYACKQLISSCARPGCPFLRNSNLANNGGTHCCAACKNSGAHGLACTQATLEERKKRKTTKKKKKTTKATTKAMTTNTPTTNTPTTTKATTKATTTTTTKPTTTKATTTTTTTIMPSIWPTEVVKYNDAFILPEYNTNTKAYFRILTNGTVSSKIACSGVLVSNGIDGQDPGGGPGYNYNAGSPSGGMKTITLTANISYTVDISSNSSISDGFTMIDTNGFNVAFGGTNHTKGQDNTFGKGKGGEIYGDGQGVSWSGSGYGAGGGGGVGNPWSSGGGGGFDPNLYYGLTASISGVPESDQTFKNFGPRTTGLGKPGVLFLEVTKP